MLALPWASLGACGNFTPGPLEEADNPIGMAPHGERSLEEQEESLRRLPVDRVLKFRPLGGEIPETVDRELLVESLERRAAAWSEGRDEPLSVEVSSGGLIRVRIAEGTPMIFIDAISKFMSRRGRLGVILERDASDADPEAHRDALVALREQALRKPGVEAWRAGQRIFTSPGEDASTWILPPGASKSMTLGRALALAARVFDGDPLWLVGSPRLASVADTTDGGRTLSLEGGDLRWPGDIVSDRRARRAWLFLDDQLLGTFRLSEDAFRAGALTGTLRIELEPGALKHEIGTRLLRAGALPVGLEAVER